MVALESNIITLTPFRIYMKDDANVIISTNKRYEELNGICGSYCRYAMALPKHMKSSGAESFLESIIGYRLHLGKSAEGLASSLEELPLLAPGKGFALNFRNLPFSIFQYKENDKDPAQIYMASAFNNNEITAFIKGLSKRNDELKNFSRIPSCRFMQK
jgi:hypothetical protein